jgi:hypothetical protein
VWSTDARTIINSSRSEYGVLVHRDDAAFHIRTVGVGEKMEKAPPKKTMEGSNRRTSPPEIVMDFVTKIKN